MSNKKRQRAKRITGDRFVLCRFSLLGPGPQIEDQGNNLAALLGRVPDYLHAADDDCLSVCRVGHWTINPTGDPSDATPRDMVTLYEITHYCDPDDDPDDE
jgi:hypothetical protein